MKQKKVYLSGTISGSYRAQNIIKALSDNGVQFLLLPTTFLLNINQPRIAKRLTEYFLNLLTLPLRLLFIINSTHVIVLPMGGMFDSRVTVLLEMIAAKLFRKVLIVDYYIGFYDTFVNDRKFVSEHSFAAKRLKWNDQIRFRLSNKIIFLNNAESIYYHSVAQVEIDKTKIKIIPLCVDYKKESLLVSRKVPGAEDSFNVCWWGTYIPLHGLENVIDAFYYLKNENIKLYIFGDSDEKAIPIVQKINSLGLNDKILVNNRCTISNGKLVPFLMDNCDLALGVFGSSGKAKTVLVNKLVDSLALRIPCLTAETAATRELLVKSEGLLITSNDPKKIAETIIHLSKNREQLVGVGDAGFYLYLDKFSPEVFSSEFIRLLE